MTTIKLIGRTTDFRGKTLWEIVGNLKNFGVGRIVVRSMFERYPEPSFLKILKVEALHDEVPRKVKVTVEKVFRGRLYPKPVEICSASYKADYRLLPKHEEANYCKNLRTPTEKLIANTMEFPPLLKQYIMEETKNPNPKMRVKLESGRDNVYRLAEDGEKPNIEITMGLGNPVSPKLYEQLQN